MTSVMGSITPQQLLDAHRADAEIQDDQSAMKAWADPRSGLVFCQKRRAPMP